MTLSKLIMHIKSLSKIANEQDDPVLINWINEMEQSLWTNRLDEFATTTISTVAGTAAYNLPSTFKFEDIDSVYQLKDGARYFMYSVCGLNDILNHGYYKINKQIGLYPVPTEAGTVEIVYRTTPALKVNSADILSLPDAFTDVYVYYLLYNIHLVQQEIDLSNNYLLQYNNRIKAVEDWWYKTK